MRQPKKRKVAFLTQLRQALQACGAKRVTVRKSPLGYFHATMNPLYPTDRHAIGKRVAKQLSLTVVGGGTLLGFGTQKAESDITFRKASR